MGKISCGKPLIFYVTFFCKLNISKVAQSWQMQQADRELIGEGLPHLSRRYTALSLNKLSYFHYLCLAVRLAAVILPYNRIKDSSYIICLRMYSFTLDLYDTIIHITTHNPITLLSNIILHQIKLGVITNVRSRTRYEKYIQQTLN